MVVLVGPNLKYCERHMHRGRNRSRKPVEAIVPLSITCTKSPNYPSSKFHSSRSCGNVLSSQDQFFMESSEKDHSYRMKEDVDEHPFLSENCGSGTISTSTGCDSWQLQPLTMNGSSSSLAQLKQPVFLDYSPTQKNQNQGRCYDELGLKIGKESENQKVMHDFFDESPQNGNDDHSKDKDSSTTRLSISTAHDFFQTYNDK